MFSAFTYNGLFLLPYNEPFISVGPHGVALDGALCSYCSCSDTVGCVTLFWTRFSQKYGDLHPLATYLKVCF